MQLLIPLAKPGEPLFKQIYRGLRKAILEGALSTGQKLPSTRALGEQLGVSRTAVLMAYEQLLAEGFVSGRAGSGTYVSKAVEAPSKIAVRRAPKVTLSRFGTAASRAANAIHVPSQAPRPHPYDFAFASATSKSFRFRLGGGSFSGARARLASPSSTTPQRPAVSPFATRFAPTCADPGRSSVIPNRSSWSMARSRPSI